GSQELKPVEGLALLRDKCPPPNYLGASLQRLADRVGDAGHVQAEVGEQFATLGMFDEVVGNAETDDIACIEAGGISGLENGAAEAPFESPLLHRDDDVRFLDCAHNGGAIERFAKASVDKTDVQPFRTQLLHYFEARREQGAENKDDRVGPPLNNL